MEDLYQQQLRFLEGQLQQRGEPLAEIVQTVDHVVVRMQIVTQLCDQVRLPHAVQNVDG
jgi:hypothetical protein